MLLLYLQKARRHKTENATPIAAAMGAKPTMIHVKFLSIQPTAAMITFQKLYGRYCSNRLKCGKAVSCVMTGRIVEVLIDSADHHFRMKPKDIPGGLFSRGEFLIILRFIPAGTNNDASHPVRRPFK